MLQVLQKATEKLLEMFPAADHAKVSVGSGSSDGKRFDTLYTVYIEFHPAIGHVLVSDSILEMAIARAMSQACQKQTKALNPPNPATVHPRMCMN